MNVGGGDSINVYAEAKSEYTRQLCQILTPCFQTYFLDLLKLAKEKEADPKRLLWNFQSLLQEIPDWNQDKVLRETEKIQKDSNCDYLEELLTAVFIAHTKVLSAIRITTKQKKLQITIPKLDHFVHRTLRETGRLLWGNAFLFAEQGSGVERQKNMRQVEGLIVEGIQQSIRSLLPVKTILREYLNDEAQGEEEGGEEDDVPAETEVVTTAATPAAEPAEKEVVETAAPVAAPPVAEPVAEPPKPETLVIDTSQKITSPPSATVKSPVTVTKEEGVVAPSPQPQAQAQAQTFVVDTEPSVGFTNMDTVFDSNDVDGNEIRAHSEFETGEVERIETLDAPPEQIDGFEELGVDDSKFEFEEIPQ
jgi:hypothetical protein